MDKLTEAGWGDEVQMLPQWHDRDTRGLILLHEHDLVRQPKPLTDRSESRRTSFPAPNNTRFSLE
jgi:hypothetical protein